MPPAVAPSGLLVGLAALLLACTPAAPGRVFGARCDTTDQCGCYDPAEANADPECRAFDTTEMVCVQSQCSLPCEFGEAGDAFCRASFRTTTHCAFEGLCAE